MAAKPIVELPELDAIDDPDELLQLVRLYHATLIAVITENNSFSLALQKGGAIWTHRTNEHLGALRARAAGQSELPLAN